VPSRRLDDRIRELCSKVCDLSDAEAEPVLRELQVAIGEKIKGLREMAAEQLVKHKDRKERRTPEK
jgi:hypothetical protein